MSGRMKAPMDGWDDDERDVLESDELGRQLEAVRARHALGPADEARLFARIQREAQASVRPARASVQWGLLLAAAAVLLIVGTTWIVRRRPAPGAVTPPEPAVASATPSPALYLALDKPAIKISPATLAWRGPVAENPLLADLKPAFDAFRADDYARADREFSAIAGKYPTSIEIALYQGVARLFIGNVQGAIESLTAAEKLADSSFAGDVGWYRAIAEERAGNLTEARARLTRLCAEPGGRAQSACDALKRLPAGRLPTP
jgi:hypothetical protein